jgi:hypothetical protein
VLLHRLQQRRLGLRRRAVDLVRQHDVPEHRAVHLPKIPERSSCGGRNRIERRCCLWARSRHGCSSMVGAACYPPEGYVGGQTPLEDDTHPVTSAGDLAFLGSRTGTVSAFAADGRLLWEKGAERGSIFALGADSTYVYATHLSGQLTAFSRATGELMWLIERGTLRRVSDEAILFRLRGMASSSMSAVISARSIGCKCPERIEAPAPGKS